MQITDANDHQRRRANLRKLPLGKVKRKRKYIHREYKQSRLEQDKTFLRYQHSKTLQVKGAADIASSIAASFKHV